jgi:hypothetical protein
VSIHPGVVVHLAGWHAWRCVQHGDAQVKDHLVAESYAERHGLTFLRRQTLRFRPRSFAGSERCVNSISGEIADGPAGVVCQRVGNRPPGLPSAQYEIPALGELIEGLWVCKSGRSVWTRVAVPRGYTELAQPDEAFTGCYRVAIAAGRDEPAVRRLLGGDFLAWLTVRAGGSGRFGFEVWRGVLFVCGPIDAFASLEKLDDFARVAARIATEVAALPGRSEEARRDAASTWACVACGSLAGSIVVDKVGNLRRDTFTGVLTCTLEGVVDSRLRDAVAAGDTATIHSLDPELVPWWCPTCRQSYCGDHWVRWNVFDEEDATWHDSIRGRCFHGHERMLED